MTHPEAGKANSQSNQLLSFAQKRNSTTGIARTLRSEPVKEKWFSIVLLGGLLLALSCLSITQRVLSTLGTCV